MPSLSAAHFGYNHQDCITACALATILLPKFEGVKVTVDRKVIAEDCFDDLELSGKERSRIQIKSHESDYRPLLLSDFTTNRISFRIDKAIRSFYEDPNPANSYCLFTSFDSPEAKLAPYLFTTPLIAPLLPCFATERYKLIPEKIWPESAEPLWPHVDVFGRDIFLAFCERFTIEINCPRSSGDLRIPGPLDNILLNVLHEKIGVGLWPNHNRDVSDAAAHLIKAASIARANGDTLDQQSVIETLALRVDYGKVEENFPIVENRLVPQNDLLIEISRIMEQNSRIAITGSPGMGKSWLLHELYSYLTENGWLTALHYCFIDAFDPDLIQRNSINTIFGSIIAQLLEKDPSLSTDVVPRFSAGPHELEKLLTHRNRQNVGSKIAIIVDGLDHADRLPGSTRPGLAAEIIHELAALQIPPGVVIVVGSQPGTHLTSYLSLGAEYIVQKWNDGSMSQLVDRMELREILSDLGLDSDYERVQEVIKRKADGNPLYGAYLVRMVLSIRDREDTKDISDVPEYLSVVPALDQNLDVYYQWLINGLARDTGVIWIGELLSLVDFPLAASEIKQIKPDIGHYISKILTHLSPVLTEDITLGGVRLYHESFQRFMRKRLESDPEANIAAILIPVANWLDSRGFYSDTRAYRSLLKLLIVVGRKEEVIARINDDFVINSIAYGQPADAVQANLSLAAEIAAAQKLWTDLTRLIELSRAAYHFYKWRLDDNPIAENYGKSFSALFGAKLLSERLLSNNRCTFPARSGLVLCKTCDDEGVIPPWIEYRKAHDIELQKNDTTYADGSNAVINIARLTGRFRLNGREQSIKLCCDLLNSSNEPPVHPIDINWTILQLYGPDALIEVVNLLPKSLARAFCYLVLALSSNNKVDAKAYAENSILDGLPPDEWLFCLEKGVDPKLFPDDILDLNGLTTKVISERIQFDHKSLAYWISAISFSDAEGDQSSLAQSEIAIQPDSWFHKWLRFCLVIYRSKSTQDEIVSALADLSQNIEVFEGKPRACDLYELHDLIRRSFRKVLSYLDDKHWEIALSALKDISVKTSTWLQSIRNGPLPLDELFELCISTANSEEKRRLSAAFGIEALNPKHRGSEVYDIHAIDQLILVRLLVFSGEKILAEKAWREACHFLFSYGERKDITVYELLDPLDKLASVDPIRVHSCLFDVQPIVEQVINHTDGRETSHAIHQWLDKAARIQPSGALTYLSQYGIDKLPNFAVLDHAIPYALEALSSQINPALLVAGWLAIGSEARSKINAALKCCVDLNNNVDLARILWNVIVGCLDGDGFNVPDELPSLLIESANRLGIDAHYEKKVTTNEKCEEKTDAILKADLHENSETIVFPILPIMATPVQITHCVRVWRDSGGVRGNSQRLSNMVGWRLIEMIEAGDEDSAESVLRQIAQDLPSWNAEQFFLDIAIGLERHGLSRFAAIANTYVYTKSRDGWRSFAGEKAINNFYKALELDPETTWSTLAIEVSERVDSGGDNGVTAHLIELLVAGGLVDEAFSSWKAACNIISHRLPNTGPQDDIDIPYNYISNGAGKWLVSVIFSRINCCFLHEKRLAVAAAALSITTDRSSFASALRFALSSNTPISTQIILLQLVAAYEPDPFEVTQIIKEDLNLLLASPYSSLRSLAKRLLTRAEIPNEIQSPTALPILPEIPKNKQSSIEEWVGNERISRINRIWPEFGKQVAKYVDVLLNSDDLKRKMQHTLHEIDPHNRGLYNPAWLPVDEEVERAVQTVGTAARSEFAKKGNINYSVEQIVGENLLQDVDITVRKMFSRIIRPWYLPRCSSQPEGCNEKELRYVPAGEYEGWVILAHIETEVQYEDDYEKSLVGEIRNYSGIQFASDWQSNEGLPLGYGHLETWQKKIDPSNISVPFDGPLAGISVTHDMFGKIVILVPHPILQLVKNLIPGPFHHGFTLIDQSGNPFIVMKYWREKLIPSTNEAHQEPSIEGMILLAKSDVVKAVSNYSVEKARYFECSNHKQLK